MGHQVIRIRSRRRSLRALVVMALATIVTSTVLLVSSVAAQPGTMPITPAATPRPTTAGQSSTTAVISSLTKAVRPSADGLFVDVRVGYRCTNTAATTYYVTALLGDVDGAFRIYGDRNDTGGLKPANCSARSPVIKVLRMVPSSNSPPLPLPAGPTFLSVSLEARGGPATPGGWYIMTGPTITASGTVAVVHS
jgi:hypothetical protein